MPYMERITAEEVEEGKFFDYEAVDEAFAALEGQFTCPTKSAIVGDDRNGGLALVIVVSDRFFKSANVDALRGFLEMFVEERREEG